MPPFCLSLGERALFVHEICDVFPLRGGVSRRAVSRPAGAACDWARGSCVRLLACAATPVDADAECAPLSTLSEAVAFVCCCTRLCGSGSARGVASGLVDAAFAVLMCLSAAFLGDGCRMLLLSFRSRFARAVASGLAATCRGCSCAALCFLGGSVAECAASASVRRDARWGEDGL